MVAEDSGAAMTAAPGVLGNDTGAGLTVAQAGLSVATLAAANVGTAMAGSFGTLQVNADGSFTYVLDNGLAQVQALNVGDTLTDNFAYQASNADGTDDALIAVTITGVNDAPDAGNDFSIFVNAAGGAAALNIAAPTDVDNDDATLTVTVDDVPVAGQVLNGGVALADNDVITPAQLQALTYQPNANLVGLAGKFTFDVSDGGGGTDSKTVTIAAFGPQINLGTLNGANGFAVTANGLAAGAAAVSGGGDFNGDGIDDLVIGLGASDRVYVLFGDGSGAFLASTNLDGLTAGVIRIDGETAGDGFGSTVFLGGDVNNDGRADLVVGAPLADNGAFADDGLGYILFGAGAAPNLALLDGSNGAKIFGGDSNDNVGSAPQGITIIGDITGDGIPDILVGVPGALQEALPEDDRGLVGIQDGAAGGFTAGNIVFSGAGAGQINISDRIGGSFLDNEDRTGSVLAGGDVNNDGIADFVVGVPNSDVTNAATQTDNDGVAYVLFGNVAGYGGEPGNVTLQTTNTLVAANGGFKVTSSNPGDNLGASAAIADVNGDGIGDVVLGIPGFDGTAGADSGAIAVIFGGQIAAGATVDISALNGTNGILIEGPSAGGAFGRSVASVGDFNGDGFADFMVGAPTDGANGSAYVVFGKASLGTSLTAADFVTPDGIDVLELIGASTNTGMS
ncbi:MAG: hypothetical protein D6782_03600, partial [Alphaproteobacteria bacterium]